MDQRSWNLATSSSLAAAILAQGPSFLTSQLASFISMWPIPHPHRITVCSHQMLRNFKTLIRPSHPGDGQETSRVLSSQSEMQVPTMSHRTEPDLTFIPH